MVMGSHQIELNPQKIGIKQLLTNKIIGVIREWPFGSPSTFKAMMNSILGGSTGSRCLVYLDDIVIYAESG
jgi:hypothetical protein